MSTEPGRRRALKPRSPTTDGGAARDARNRIAFTHIVRSPVGFEFALLCLAVFYAIGSFRLPLWTLEGGLGGAGFFPRALSLLLIASLAIAMIHDARTALRSGTREEEGYGLASRTRAVLLQIGLLAAFLFLFVKAGVWIAAGVYIVAGMCTLESKPSYRSVGVALVTTYAFLLLIVKVLHADLP